MSEEIFKILHNKSSDIDLRIYNILNDSEILSWNSDSLSWEDVSDVTESERNISMTEITDVGDNDESLYITVVDLQDVHDEREPLNVLFNVIENDKIIAQEEGFISNGKMASRVLSTESYGGTIVQITEDTVDIEGNALGIVETREGVAIPDARVVAYDLDDLYLNDPLYKTTTDGDGRFNLTVMKGTTYQIVFLSQEFEKEIRIVSVGDDLTVDDIDMSLYE